MSNEAKIKFSAEDKTSAAFASISRSADKLGFNLNTLKGGAIAALSALAVPVSSVALVNISKASLSAIDSLKDLSEAVGSSVEKISAIDGLNREVGGSFDTLSAALVKFNGILKDADPDKGAGAVLKALNLEIEELKRLDPVDAMQRVAVALNQWADDGNRARAVQELFGKSVKEIAPFMRDLAEASTLQARVTTRQAEEVSRFNEELAKLKATSEDVGRSISVDLVTEINDMVDRLNNGASAWDAFFGAAEAGARRFHNGKLGFNNLVEDPKDQTDAETARLDRQSGFYNPDNQSVAELARLTRKRSLNIPASNGSTSNGSPRGGAGEDPYAKANRYLDNLRQQLQASAELTEYEKLLVDIRSGSLGKLNPALEAQLKATAQQLDMDKELTAITEEFKALNDAAARSQQALKEEARGFFEATRTPIERLNIELARQDELLRKLGPSYKETYMRANEAAQDRYDSETKLTQQISELDQFAQRAAQNMQDYLGDSFQQIMEGNFENVGDAFVSMLNNMVAQAAAANLAEHLLGKYATGKGDGTGLLGSALTSLANFAGFKAEGGPVQSGKGYIVGERGPEWFEPATSGTVVPNHALGGQTVQVNNHFSFSSPVDRRTQQQVAAAAGRGVQLAMSRNG
ncbi:hypothetical protein [Hydrogenophaga sp.]|uniref:hypothetical protein n=1 Tax=Hydrogenophaga sp. TaxID=1904254 RepID=UPI00286D8A25|nr:hypothetical protein [Hydrogenophaga sp.]